jgi:hypothetical protein
VTRAALVAVGLLLASLARADGAMCEKGMRDTTPDERATVTRVLEAAKAALPAAPAGWSIGGYEEISAPATICGDVEAVPWSYGVSRTYNRVDDVAERERALEEQGAALKADMATKQPEIDAAMARVQALGAELASAGQRGDQARADAINAELEQISKQLEALLNDAGTQAHVAAVGETLRDVEMSIAVAVNPAAVASADHERMDAPAGASEAFRWTATTGDGVTRAHALVLVRGERASPAPAEPRALSFHAEADPARLDALVRGIDFGAAARLVR